MKKNLTALLLALTLALSLAACGGSSGGESKSADLTAFYETLASDETLPAMMLLEEEQLEAYYPGLSGVAAKQRVVALAAISSVAGELALVEVEDAGDLETVKGILQARIDYQVGDGNGPGGAFYPETMENWEKNSRIVSNGNTVMLVVCEDAGGAVERFQALFA